MSDKESVEKSEPKKWPDEWMLKPCAWYDEEYKDCKCFRAQFNQYFIHGKTADCTQWKTDYENCMLWRDKGDEEAYKAFVASEKARRSKRLLPHYNNDTWEKRDKPPENWNKPLPEDMQKRYEGTLLWRKQQQLKTGEINDLDVQLPLCTIL